MRDRYTLEEDLDRVMVGIAPEPAGEWDWEPPLGSAIPASLAIPASPAVSAAEPSEPEDTDESDDESDQEQDSEDDA